MAKTTSAGTFVHFTSDSTTSAYSEGQIVSLDTSGNVTAVAAAEETTLIGVVHKGKVATTSAEQHELSVQVGGVAEVLSFVADTDGSAGYDAPIVVGDRLLVDASGRVVNFGGTGGTVTEANEVGEAFCIALEANAGSTSADTTAYIKVLLLR